LTLALFPAWILPGWWEIVFQIIQNLLGFSLGGFAIWLAFGGERFSRFIAGGKEGKTSPYMEATSNFVHFILLQLAAIVGALACQVWYIPIENANSFVELIPAEVQLVIGWLTLTAYAFSFWLFVYALLSTIPATLTLFRGARWFDMYASHLDENKNDKEGF
jgi:hypothetical protein